MYDKIYVRSFILLVFESEKDPVVMSTNIARARIKSTLSIPIPGPKINDIFTKCWAPILYVPSQTNMQRIGLRFLREKTSIENLVY